MGRVRDGRDAPVLDRATAPAPFPTDPEQPVRSFTAPAKVSAAGSQQEFLTGVAVGAGLVVLGVVVGGLFGRRR